MEPGSEACQVVTGSHTFSFITCSRGLLPGSYHSLIFMRFLGFCVDNKGQAAIITLDPLQPCLVTALTSQQDTVASFHAL